MELIEKNNQAVRIISVGGDMFRSLHLVNTRNGFDAPEATVVQAKSHRTLAGARKWAGKQLVAA